MDDSEEVSRCGAMVSRPTRRSGRFQVLPPDKLIFMKNILQNENISGYLARVRGRLTRCLLRGRAPCPDTRPGRCRPPPTQA